LDIPNNACVLDVGCGGGANIKKLLELCPYGTVKGVDYSEISVDKSRRVNAKEIQLGRCQVHQADVMELPFEDNSFHVVTAFETVYFWPDLPKSFQEIFRVLKNGGTFVICNESNGETNMDEKWAKIIRGMTIYTGDQLRKAILQTGFSSVRIHNHNRGWLCVVANKSVET
ncbi:MAG: class I SAM-dependent methyltransferase, partial [Ignavibacteria bacterium]|nr:class I SAM-dependent methyltransferase [Ignavibacteria bacterium]